VVDILIDRLVADRQTGILCADPPRNEFRRPVFFESCDNIGSDSVVLEPWSVAGLCSAFSGPVVRSMVHIAPIDGRSVAS